jgi:hypothetical protein
VHDAELHGDAVPTPGHAMERTDRHRVSGELTFHGVTPADDGTAYDRGGRACTRRGELVVCANYGCSPAGLTDAATVGVSTAFTPRRRWRPSTA